MCVHARCVIATHALDFMNVLRNAFKQRAIIGLQLGIASVQLSY